MTAAVLPFPLRFRVSFIERQAEIAAAMRPEAAERYIQRQLQTQAVAMRRKGVGEALIAIELVSMEGAVRAALLCWGGQSGGAN